jgi:hypothetical protein
LSQAPRPDKTSCAVGSTDIVFSFWFKEEITFDFDSFSSPADVCFCKILNPRNMMCPHPIVAL